MVHLVSLELADPLLSVFEWRSWSTTATEADSTLPPLQEEQGSRLKRVVFELLKTARRWFNGLRNIMDVQKVINGFQ